MPEGVGSIQTYSELKLNHTSRATFYFFFSVGIIVKFDVAYFSYIIPTYITRTSEHSEGAARNETFRTKLISPFKPE